MLRTVVRSCCCSKLSSTIPPDSAALIWPPAPPSQVLQGLLQRSISMMQPPPGMLCFCWCVGCSEMMPKNRCQIFKTYFHCVTVWSKIKCRSFRGFLVASPQCPSREITDLQLCINFNWPYCSLRDIWRHEIFLVPFPWLVLFNNFLSQIYLEYIE